MTGGADPLADHDGDDADAGAESHAQRRSDPAALDRFLDEEADGEDERRHTQQQQPTPTQPELEVDGSSPRPLGFGARRFVTFARRRCRKASCDRLAHRRRGDSGRRRLCAGGRQSEQLSLDLLKLTLETFRLPLEGNQTLKQSISVVSRHRGVSSAKVGDARIARM